MPLLAQNQPNRAISLEEAIQIALENNYQIKQAQNNLDLSDEEVFRAKMNFMPDLSVSTSYNYQVGRQFNQATVSFQDQVVNSISGRIGSNITVFDGLRNIYTLRRANSAKESQQLQLERAMENLIFSVASQFLQVILDRELLQIAEENLIASNKQLEQVKAQVEVGSRPVADLYNQESVVANSEFALIQRQSAADINRQNLVRTLQIDPLIEYDFEQPNIPEIVKMEDFDVNVLVKTALANRSDVKSQEYQIQSSELSFKMAKSARLPTISMSAGLSTSYNDRYRLYNANTGNVESVSFNKQFFDQNINRFVGFSLSVPIFSRWNTQYNVESALVSYKNAKLSLDNTRLQVIQEVKQAYLDYQNYSKQLGSTRKAMIASEKALQTQQERYNIGSSTLIELTQANADFVQASSNFTQAKYRLVFQEQLIKYYMGLISSDITF